MIHTLIADDSKTELDVLLFLIQKNSLPLDAVTASNGEEALEELKKERFDLLITDIRMPFLDGLSLAGEALRLYPYIKIVISSGYQDFSYAKTAISLGVKEYLLKPVNPEEFTELILQLTKQIEKEQILRIPLQAAVTEDTSPRSLHDLVEYMTSELSGSRQKESSSGTSFASDVSGLDSSNGKVRFICDYISSHYSEDLSLEGLADMIYIHPDYLSRMFKKETGMNLNRYIKTIRMNKACQLLENSQQKITAISAAVGYQNCAYFIRTFTSTFGISPEKYRQKNSRKQGGKKS